MTASAVQVTTCATTCRCLAASERTSSSASIARASMRARNRSRAHCANLVSKIAPSTSNTITRPLPRAQLLRSVSGAIAPVNVALQFRYGDLVKNDRPYPGTRNSKRALARPHLDQQAQHVRLGETLDDPVAAEVQDGQVRGVTPTCGRDVS